MTRKQTSAKVSKLAAKYLALSDDEFRYRADHGGAFMWAEIRTLAASCLSQDEVKGSEEWPEVVAKLNRQHRRKVFEATKTFTAPEPFKTVPLSTFTKAERAKLLAGEVLIKTEKPRKRVSDVITFRKPIKAKP